ncbi:HNH endonuclease [Nodosilinea sp. LEGE 07088]|uniref:HNH endonuclease n=1 Tax=Nodosilinea sp. LEGE 07088 TaxID=2777968 RepID=UPI00188143D8|nr:HNH endonuclease signature motif containing protein [Nodosilinea sp. LEGE 07088]MBE9141086.1 HNH endonuclease [Nodosilinea sp. LEGE 07088]
MSAYIPSAIQKQIRDRFANCYAYCRTAEALTVTTFEVDHIVPLSAGGATVFENLCLACPTCNRYKANRQTAIDPETQAITPLFHPQQQRWTDHFGWNAEAIEVVGLTAIGRATVAMLKMNRPQMTRVRKMWVKLGEHPSDVS